MMIAKMWSIFGNCLNLVFVRGIPNRKTYSEFPTFKNLDFVAFLAPKIDKFSFSTILKSLSPIVNIFVIRNLKFVANTNSNF